MLGKYSNAWISNGYVSQCLLLKGVYNHFCTGLLSYAILTDHLQNILLFREGKTISLPLLVPRSHISCHLQNLLFRDGKFFSPSVQEEEVIHNKTTSEENVDKKVLSFHKLIFYSLSHQI